MYPMMKDLIQKIGKRYLKLNFVQDLPMETLENE